MRTGRLARLLYEVAGDSSLHIQSLVSEPTVRSAVQYNITVQLSYCTVKYCSTVCIVSIFATRKEKEHCLVEDGNNRP